MPESKRYDDTIINLQARKSSLLVELEALDKVIAILRGIDKPVRNDETLAHLPSHPAQKSGRFATISLRWSCLWVLSEAASSGLTTNAIAEILIAGGRQSKADKFAGTVSAVLSNMKYQKEIDQFGGLWALTEKGKQAWEMIMPRLTSQEDKLSAP